ncbi:MAG: LEA type 2 family protein [Treponema sp.]|jgi:LEA14-like dessication related protein|nr:LEA type 2 family protein [Treponema sp.]
MVPHLSVVLDHVEASTPDTVKLHMVLYTANPGTEGVLARLTKSGVTVNGKELSGGFESGAEEKYIKPGEREEIRAVCTLDLKSLSPPLPPETSLLDTRTIFEMGFSFDGGGRSSASAETEFSFPRIRQPEFSIVSIAIMQAELINTRFKVKVRIKNPNRFPLALSSFKYELYGHGRYWAGGSERDVYEIPENGEAEKDLFLLMNFINMPRDLLDQVIAMRSVRYRFVGEADIGTGIAYLPSFVTAFDLRGDSEVIK